MSRSIARDLALKKLYATYLGGEGSSQELWAMTAQPEDKKDKRNFRRADALVEGVCNNEAELAERIRPHLHNWSLERLDLIDRCILYIAVFEAYFDEETAVSIAFNEAVETAKIYCDDKSPSFINGVLGAVDRAPESETSPILEESDEALVEAE